MVIMDKLIQAYDLMIISVIKPDTGLRAEAKGFDCYDELMEIRKEMINFLQTSRSTLKRCQNFTHNK